MNIRKKWRQLALWQKIFFWIAAACLAWTLLGFFILPPVTRVVLEKQLRTFLHRDTKVGRVEFNPWTLEMQIGDFRVSRSDKPGALISFRQLSVNLESASIVKRALILSSIRLDKPCFDFTRYADGRFSFDDLIPADTEKKEEKQGRPFYFSLNNIEINQGSLVMMDLQGNTANEIKDINLAIPFISNMAHKVDIYVKPSFAAVINGASVAFTGSSKPFKSSRDTRLDINLKDLDLTHYTGYLPDFLNFIPDSGWFNCHVILSFIQPVDDVPVISLDGTAGLRDVELRMRNRSGASRSAEKLFSMKGITVEFLPSSLLKGDVHLKKISILSPDVTIKRDSNGRLNLSMLVDRAGKNTESPHAASAGSKNRDESSDTGPKIRVDLLELSGGRVDFSDDSNGVPFRRILSDVTLSARNISTAPGDEASFTASFSASGGEEFSMKGGATLSPLSVNAALSLHGVGIPGYSPWYSRFLNGSVDSGIIDLDAGIHAKVTEGAGKPVFSLSDIKVELHNLGISGISKGGSGDISGPDKGKDELVEAELLRILIKEFDPASMSMVISDVSLSGARVKAVLLRSGGVNLASIVRQQHKAPDTVAPVTEKTDSGVTDSAPPGNKKSFMVSLAHLSIDSSTVEFVDENPETPVKVKLFPVSLDVENIDTAPGSRFTFSIDTGINGSGKFHAEGDSDLAAQKVHVNALVQNLPLSLFHGYIVEVFPVNLRDGDFNWEGTVDITRDSEGRLVTALKGQCSATGVSAYNASTGQRFNTWKALRVKGLEMVVGQPFILNIDELLIDGTNELVVLDQKGRLNMSRIFTRIRKASKEKDMSEKAGEAALQGAGAGKGEGAEKESGESAPPVINIRLVKARNGRIKFVDNSVKPPFSATLTRVNADFKGLSNKPGTRADVSIRAVVNNNASLLVTGRVNPMTEPRFIDLNIKVQDVGMSRFTPYAAKYIGYLISKGKLNLDLHYKIDGSRLDASNVVLFDQFTLGNEMENETATSLPVKLAITLLTDRNGQIKLDIPLEGDINSPDFSIAGTVFQIIGNLIMKAATSPFSLIAAAFGGGEELEYVQFQPGSSELPESEIEKLRVMAQALNDHPAIKVELMGGYDHDVDSSAMQENRFNLLIKKAKYDDLDKDQQAAKKPEDVVVAIDEYEEYLEDAWKEAPIKKEKNFIGLIKGQPVPVMEKMLKEYCTPTDGDLRTLAIERADAVENYLVEQGHVDATRIFMVEPGSRERNAAIPPTSVEVNLK